eukprot:TRINITY_DN73508_c0_g1_i1.p2 TRINITY_DN73508_c0_g1~~TRINITY_DN73508_c0_g1_i1.p2  ORF type:complete len:164 (+),score=9.63 TRINITY_DN73508_c0_g1_i1:104-595(+)
MPRSDQRSACCCSACGTPLARRKLSLPAGGEDLPRSRVPAVALDLEGGTHSRRAPGTPGSRGSHGSGSMRSRSLSSLGATTLQRASSSGIEGESAGAYGSQTLKVEKLEHPTDLSRISSGVWQVGLPGRRVGGWAGEHSQRPVFGTSTYRPLASGRSISLMRY